VSGLALGNPLLTRLFALHGTLHLLQGLSEDELSHVMPAICEFLLAELDQTVLAFSDCDAIPGYLELSRLD
jgi:hypothetical protein